MSASSTTQKGEAELALPPSKLGTKTHWDECYERELENWNDAGEEGEVWFGEQAARRMVSYLKRTAASLPDNFTALDLGTGNGLLLQTLHEAELTQPSRLMGVDYSEGSIQLARSIAADRADGAEEIRWQVADLVGDQKAVQELGTWDVVLDKGTLDAIALSPNAGTEVPAYVRATRQLRGSKGFLLLTSCNFTEEELRKLFTADDEGAHDEVADIGAAPPSFSFGGKTGSTTTAVTVRPRNVATAAPSSTA